MSSEAQVVIVNNEIVAFKRDIKQARKLSNGQIQVYLSKLPETKAKAAQVVLSTKDELTDAQFDLKRVMAKHQVIASLEKDKYSSSDDRKAYVLEQEDVILAERRVQKAMTNHESAKIVFQYYDDLFVSVRKQANFVEKELEAQAQYAKYHRASEDQVI